MRSPTTAAYAILATVILCAIRYWEFNWPSDDDFVLLGWYDHFVIRRDASISDLLSAHLGSHPMATPALLSTVLFRVAGIDFNMLVYTSAIALIISTALLASWCCHNYECRMVRVGLPIGLVLIAFHPSQTNHLLWAFELSWFLVNSTLFINVYLLERFGNRVLPYIAVTSIFGSFSTAQGSILWLAAGLHLALKSDIPGRLPWISLFMTAFVLQVMVIVHMTPATEGLSASTTTINAISISAYAISIFGMPFAIRAPQATFGLGSLVLVALALHAWEASRTRGSTGIDRIATVLVGASLGFVSLFAYGRYQYGLTWALSLFHAAPLLVPLLAGLLLLASRTLDRATLGLRYVSIAILSLVVVGTSLITAIPYALERANEVQMRKAFAMHVSCTAGQSQYVIENSNMPGHFDFVLHLLPLIQHLCRPDLPANVRALLTFPQLFIDRIAADPRYGPALRDLWEVYQTHFDLIRAYPVASPNTPKNLMIFAHNDAKNGSGYEPPVLAKHKDLFAAMAIVD
jgi:hypothetical protein